MAIDPSLTCSGWALFSIGTGQLLAVGKVRSLSCENSLAIRLKDLQLKIRCVAMELGLGRDDVLVCESPTTMRDPKAALKVEQVRGIFETVAREMGIKVPGRLNPRSVQYEVMGLKGKQLARDTVKNTALQIADRLYGRALRSLGFEDLGCKLKKHQDIVDALLVGTLAMARVKTALATNCPMENMFEERARMRRRRA